MISASTWSNFWFRTALNISFLSSASGTAVYVPSLALLAALLAITLRMQVKWLAGPDRRLEFNGIGHKEVTTDTRRWLLQ